MRRFHWIGWDAVAALGGATNRVKCATSETSATGRDTDLIFQVVPVSLISPPFIDSLPPPPYNAARQ
jgi:hypothetical protein